MVKRYISMSQSLKLTYFIVISFIGNESTSFLLDGHANPSSATNRTCGTYNIYDKIDAIERETQKKIQDMETMLRQVLLTVNQMDVKLENSNIHNMSLEIERLKKVVSNGVKNSTDIGFTTQLYGSYNRTSDIIKGHNYPIFNAGNAYNGSVFTCPSQGLYLFQVSLISSTGLGAWIYKNGQQLTFAYTTESSQVLYNSGSVSLVISLDIGDQVYLQPNSASLSVDPFSVFTGVKIN